MTHNEIRNRLTDRLESLEDLLRAIDPVGDFARGWRASKKFEASFIRGILADMERDETMESVS